MLQAKEDKQELCCWDEGLLFRGQQMRVLTNFRSVTDRNVEESVVKGLGHV